MTFKLKITSLLAGNLLLGCVFTTGVEAAPDKSCFQGITRALSELDTYSRKVSLIDGSEIINIHSYVHAMEANPRWQAFAQKIKEMRQLEAPKLNNKRNAYNAARIDPDYLGHAPGYGYARMKKDALTLEGRTVESAFNRFNPGQDYEMINDSGKIIITPKNKVIGQSYVEIRYDISGNYFRLQKGKYSGGKILKFASKDEQFIDWSGNIINTSGLRDNPKRFDELMKKSHWNAIRE